MKHVIRSLIGTLLAAATVTTQAGPIGIYYLTDFANNKIDAIQGNAFHANPTAFPDSQNPPLGPEGPIAVFLSGMIRTAYWLGVPLDGAAEYVAGPNLTVSPIGTLNTDADDLKDGTTDGQHNYAVQYQGGVIRQYDTHWANSSVLFILPPTSYGGYEGITYDPFNNSLWISTDFGFVGDYSLGGTLLSSFNTVAGLSGVRQYALALDVDRTLWLADATSATSNGIIRHYDTNGTFLGSDTYAGIGQAFGGEIPLVGEIAIPEPTTLALFVAGLTALRIGRRGKRVARRLG